MTSTRKDNLRQIEKRINKTLNPKNLKRYFWPITVILGGLFLLGIYFIFKDVPNPSKLTKKPSPISTQILDRHGKLLYEVYSDYRRTPIAFENIPDYVKQATVSIEDKNFYHHFGLDFVGITRAAFNTLTGKRLEGGSTLTQQLIKIAVLSDSSRSILRKIREAVLAIATEFTYSKDQILELYLNHAPYGGTVYGIETAAQNYFGKSAKDLNLAEASLLAGLPQSPTRYSPFGANPQLAIDRQYEVLRRMTEDGYITPEEAETAKNTPLQFLTKNITINAPHFSLMVRDELVAKYGEEKVNLGGLRVTTTLDLDLQQYIEASLSAEMAKIAKLKIQNGAALVTKPNTGEVLALVGSKDYFNDEIDGQVNLTKALRQPGSSIKPLNYAVGLLRGWTAGTMFLDIPTCFNVVGQKSYCPKNYDNTFRGPVSMRQSLANSLNIPAVKMLALNGLDSFIATASAMGISTWTNPDQYGLSLTLGGGEVTMYDLVTAFGTFANRGVTVPLNSIIKVETYDGQVLEEINPENTALTASVYVKNWSEFQSNQLDSNSPVHTSLPEEVTFIISDILSDNNARSAAFGPNSELVIPGQTVSVKTGTTNDLKDNWTIGYTKDFLAATWVGNNDNSSMSYVASGVTGASPIWHDIMAHLLKNEKNTPLIQPENIINYQVCNLTGLLAQEENQCESHSEFFIKDQLPVGQNQAPLRQQIWVRRSDKFPILLGDETIDRDLEEHTVVSDPFTKNFCLDCSYPVDEKGHISWPSTTINYQPYLFNYLTPQNFLSVN